MLTGKIALLHDVKNKDFHEFQKKKLTYELFSSLRRTAVVFVDLD